MEKNDGISEEEISREWTIDVSSRKLIEKVNRNHRLWFTIQLFAMKRYGRFLENPNELSSSIISYLSTQLGLPISFPIEKPLRKGTYLSQRKLIFEHLNFRNFDNKDLESLFIWGSDLLNKGAIFVDQLYFQAERFLIVNRIALPSTKQLRRWLKSLCSQYYTSQYEKIYPLLPLELIKYIDSILMLDGSSSWFDQLKEYPDAASISTLKQYLLKYEKLCEIELNYTLLQDMNQDFINYHYKLARYYSADKIKRFKPDKRYTLIALFLFESKKHCIDYLIQLHDQYISDICRKCSNINEEQIRQYRHKYSKAIDKFIIVVDHLLNQDSTASFPLSALYQKAIPKNALKEAREDVKTYQRIIKCGYAYLLQNRYNSMRRYFSDFIKLPFFSESSNSSLLSAIKLIRQTDDNIFKEIPANAPVDFIDYKIKPALADNYGNLKRNIWEMGVAIALREALRSGDVYVPHSKRHVFFGILFITKRNGQKIESKFTKNFVFLQHLKQQLKI